MKRTYTKSLGFTIVELLIVIVVIAILASLSYVVYNGIQGNVRKTAGLAEGKCLTGHI